jgi:5,10-methenyltetrahydromethanopterin hydrogenase
VRGDGPVEAVLEASSRVLARPAPYLLAVLGFGVLSLMASAAIQSVGTLATGFATRTPALLTMGPVLMLAAVTAVVAAALELWWWASLTVLVAREG